MMSDIETLLKDFLIIPDQLPKNNKEYLESEKYYENLDTCLRTDENWNLFFQNNFNVNEVKKKIDSYSEEERIKIFKFGIGCFIQFVHCNFTGPGLEKQTEEYLTCERFTKIPFNHHLAVNNEEINVNTKHPALLFIAKIIFEHCLVHDILNNWWNWRSILIHQEILDDLSPTLLSDADRLYKLLQHNLSLEG